VSLQRGATYYWSVRAFDGATWSRAAVGRFLYGSPDDAVDESGAGFSADDAATDAASSDLRLHGQTIEVMDDAEATIGAASTTPRADPVPVSSTASMPFSQMGLAFDSTGRSGCSAWFLNASTVAMSAHCFIDLRTGRITGYAPTEIRRGWNEFGPALDRCIRSPGKVRSPWLRPVGAIAWPPREIAEHRNWYDWAVIKVKSCKSAARGISLPPAALRDPSPWIHFLGYPGFDRECTEKQYYCAFRARMWHFQGQSSTPLRATEGASFRWYDVSAPAQIAEIFGMSGGMFYHEATTAPGSKAYVADGVISGYQRSFNGAPAKAGVMRLIPEVLNQWFAFMNVAP
jgi:hypothetical protein